MDKGTRNCLLVLFFSINEERSISKGYAVQGDRLYPYFKKILHKLIVGWPNRELQIPVDNSKCSSWNDYMLAQDLTLLICHSKKDKMLYNLRCVRARLRLPFRTAAQTSFHDSQSYVISVSSEWRIGTIFLRVK